jgi:hypothetical protein
MVCISKKLLRDADLANQSKRRRLFQSPL